MISYALTVVNNQRAAPPAEIHLDVYDPNFQVIKQVPVYVTPDATNPNKFGGSAVFPMAISTAGDYHFVVEARQKDELGEGKDRNKWALEQNGFAQGIPYATFGSQTPGLNDDGFPGRLDTTSGASRASDTLHAIGYANSSALRHRPYWVPTIMGYNYQVNVDTAIGATNIPIPADAPTAWKQTIQYNSIWCFVGHGNISGRPYTGRRIQFYDGDKSGSNGGNVDAANRSYLVTTQAVAATQSPTSTVLCLDQLPPAWNVLNRPDKALCRSRLLVFIGCNTTTTAFNNPSLPQLAVSLGAKSAVGCTGILDNDKMNKFATVLFQELAKETDSENNLSTSLGEAVNTAKRAAGFNAAAGENALIYGSAGTQINPTHWGSAP